MEDFITTRGAKNKINVDKLYEVVTFKSHKKSLNSTTESKKIGNHILHKSENEDDSEIMEDNEPIDEKRKQELEMKRFRYDVIKFGMSGFEKQKSRQAKVALAISLGAQPPKNKRKNYKKLIQQRKTEKIQELKKQKFASGFNSNQLLNKNTKKDKFKSNLKKNKESNGILGVYGKVTKNNDKISAQKNHKGKR